MKATWPGDAMKLLRVAGEGIVISLALNELGAEKSTETTSK